MSRVGELFVWGFQGPVIPNWVREFAQRFGLGGIILFDYSVQTKTYENNIQSPEQLRELCAQIHELPSRPWVWIDQEGGKVRRLKEARGFAPLVSAHQYNVTDVQVRTSQLDRAYAEMRALGIDVNMSPVVDLNINPLNPDIGKVERSYSAVAGEVLTCAREVLAAAEKHGMGTTLKHFPGLGGAKVNSHEELTDLSDVVTTEQMDIFGEAARTSAAPCVLLSHGLVREWGNEPVSMSARAVSEVRRRCPDALIITDDLQMQGLQKIFPTPRACAKALRAGVDLICIGNNLLNDETRALAIAADLESQMKSDSSLAARVSESVERYQQWRKKVRP